MNSKDIESQLSELGANWPIDSVVEAVSSRLDTLPTSQAAKPHSHRLQLTLAGSILLLIVCVSIFWMSMFAAPLSLAAQVKDAMGKAATAYIVATHIGAQGKRSETTIWYSRKHGVRYESTNWIFVDDGQQKWGWNPTTNESERSVERRTSLDGLKEVCDALQLESIPAAWRQSRLAELDRDLRGERCLAYLIEPPANFTTSLDNGATQTRLRYIMWLDFRRRVVQTDWQKQVNDAWITDCHVTFEYDVEIAAAKFAVKFPENTRIVDGDQLWANRFPINKALTTVVSGGLLFAVHEVTRCESDMFYIVSSVRGTAEYLKKYPPVPRRFNLRFTLLDVAEQDSGVAVNERFKTAISCSAHEVGVHYRFWLAIPRRPYWMNNGIREDANYPSKLEIAPGQIRIPLSARYTGGLVGTSGEQVESAVVLPQSEQSVPIAEIARRCLRDASLDPDGLVLYGAVKDDQAQRMISAETTEADYAKVLREQIDWLNSRDEVKDGQLVSPALDWIGIPVQLPRRIEGQVIDADDSPVANAKVTVQIRRFKDRTQINDPNLPQPWIVSTDQQGHYEFSTAEPFLLSEDMLCITTEVAGFPKLKTTDSKRQVVRGILPLQKLPPRRTIQGRIVDPQGKPALQTKFRVFANTAELSLWSSEWISVDDNGAFSVVIPKDGKALIQIVPVEFAPQVVYISDGANDIGFIRLETGTSLHGRVVDHQGQGIAGTVVAIEDEHPKHLFELFICPSSAGARTDENGAFTLPPFYGKCKVYVTDEAKEYDTGLSVVGTKPNSIPPQIVDLTGKEKTKEINFRKTK